MPLDPAPGTARRAISPLDHRVEAATGHAIDTLWAYSDRGVLDEPHARLVDRHRELAKAENSVTFHRQLLNRLTSGEFLVDSALLARIERASHQLEEAAGERDAATASVIAALEPIETAARTTQPDGHEPLPAADQAALLAIAGGAKLHDIYCPAGCPWPPPPALGSHTPTCSGSKRPGWSRSPATPAIRPTPGSRSP